MNKNVIFYQAHTQFENTGDLIISKSLLDLLRPCGRLIVNDHGVPLPFVQQLGVSEDEKLIKYLMLNKHMVTNTRNHLV